MIKNVVFDMGQVLIRFSPPLLTDRLGYTGEDKELLLREVFGSEEWMALDRGRMSPQEGSRSICRRLPERLHGAVDALINDWWKGELLPIEGMKELIEELKGMGYGIYLLSNASSYLNVYFHRIPASEFFDGMIVSADLGMLKPQHEIYETLYNKYSLDPKECYFIDDSALNIDGAACTGMAGSVFYGDMSRLRRELMAAGVPVKQTD